MPPPEEAAAPRPLAGPAAGAESGRGPLPRAEQGVLSAADQGSLSNDLQVAATHRLIEALVASEHRMRLRVDLLSEIVFELDAGGAFVFLSRAWTQLIGIEAERVIGLPLRHFVDPDDRALYARILGEAPAQPSFRRPVVRLTRADGATLAMELSIVALRDGGHMGALHDVTEQRRVQQAYERLSLVASHTDNFVVITDARGRTEWVNDAFVRATGYTLEELLGRKPGEVLQGPQTDAAEVARFSRELASGRSFASELVNYRKDGTPYWITIHVTPIHDEQGALVRFISVQTDSTELRLVRTQLEEARRRAEDASRAKSQFLSAMSHEIRTPINGVLGLTTLLLDSGLDATQHRYASMIASSGNSLLAIINDILDFSKIEAGKLTIEDIDFDLDELLEDLVGLHRHRAREKALSLRARTEPSVPRLVRGDAHRLRQVLNNLLGNACKFTERGSIALTVAVAECGSPRVRLRFEVSDTGIGVPADKQALLFLPFSQADSSNSRRFGGTGLGLSITKQLVELMGGSIAMQSTVGAGSTFTVELPFTVIDRIGPRSAVVGEGISVGRSPARLLVVEDNLTNQIVARGLLAKLGFADIAIVGDGAQAVEAVRNGTYDLVLMDCQMPVMDGYTATARLRELGFTLPVVAMTANAMRGDREMSLAAGMNDHLSKPILLQDLAAMIDRWLPPRGPDGASDGVAQGSGDGTADASADSPADASPAGSRGAAPAGAVAIEPPAPAAPSFDRAVLLERVGGDAALFAEILRAAERDLPRTVERLIDAMRAGDCAAARLHAHSLKGATATIGAVALCQEAVAIEARARAGELPPTDRLAAELQRFRRAIAAAGA